MNEQGGSKRLRRSTITFMSREVQTYHDLRVPEWFDVLYLHSDFPEGISIRVRVRPDNRLVAAGVMASGDMTYRDGADALKGEPLPELLHDAAKLAAGIWEWEQGKRDLGIKDGRPLTEDEMKQLGERITKVNDVRRTVPPPGRQRRVMVPDLLREVAEVYREALQQGKPPTLSVAEHYNTSHRTAARWVSEARKKGILNPALGPTAGESPTVPPAEA